MDLADVQSFQVDSMPVVLRSTPSYGDIVAFQITSNGGPTLSDKSGAVELLLKTISSGTPSYSKEEIDRILTMSGAVFSVDPRQDYLEISVKCLKRFLPVILPILSEMIRTPLLTQEEIELSRSQLMTDLQNEKDHPDAILQLLSHKSFYAHHPYLNRASGFLETVPSIQREDLVTALKNTFNKSNVLFFWVGDLSKQEVSGLVKTYFETLPAGARAAAVTTPLQNPIEAKFEKFESPTTYFIARFKAPALKDEDYPAFVLASQILDNRLFEEVRTKRALTYSVHASLGNSLLNSGYLYVTSTKLKEAVKVMFDEVKRLQEEPLDTQTIEHQIRKFTASWYLSREQSSSQAKIFSLYEMIGPGWQASNTFIERLSKVTPDSIQQASKKYFKDFTVSVVGPENISLDDIIPGLPVTATKAAPAKSSKK